MRRSLCVLAVLLAATAAGQSTLTPYENASLAYRIGYPSDWIVAASPDGDYLNIQPREGSDAYGRVGILDLGSAALGLDVRGADLTGQDVTFRIVLALHHERLYGLLLKALSSDFASFEPLFDRMQASFVLLDAAGHVLFRHPEPSPEPPCNPLVPGSCLESGSEPEAPCNPLVPGECSDSSSDRGAAPPIRDPITAPRVEPDMREGIAAFDRHDYATALAVFQPLAQQGVAEAQHYVGYLHEHGLAGPQDHREALRWYRLAAAQGHPTAQNNLGSMYFGGHGVTQDHAEAARWFRLAADQHHMLAQEWLGYLHEHGFGVPRDHLEAIRWYRLAAAQGCQRSQQAIERLSGTR